MQGSYQLIFKSPESLLGSRRWCQNLQKEPFVSDLAEDVESYMFNKLAVLVEM